MERVMEIDSQLEELRTQLANVKGRDTEVYTRIVGYHRAVANWNKGKREEYFHRKVFKYDNVGIDNKINSATISVQNDNKIPDVENCDLSITKEQVAYYKFFYSKYCHNCQPVKNAIKNTAIPGEEVDVGIDFGFDMSKKYNVIKTPTVVLLDKNENVLNVIHTVEEIQKILV